MSGTGRFFQVVTTGNHRSDQWLEFALEITLHNLNC